MGIMADHVGQMSKEHIAEFHHKLLEAFLFVLDYRTTQYKVSCDHLSVK